MLKCLIITTFLGLSVLGLPGQKLEIPTCAPFDPFHDCCFKASEYSWVGELIEDKIMKGIIDHLNMDPMLIPAGEEEGTGDWGSFKVVWDDQFNFIGLNELMISHDSEICTYSIASEHKDHMKFNGTMKLGSENGGTDAVMKKMPLKIYYPCWFVCNPLNLFIVPSPIDVTIPDITIDLIAMVNLNLLDCAPGAGRITIEEMKITEMNGAIIEDWIGWGGLQLADVLKVADSLAWNTAKVLEKDMKIAAQEHLDENDYFCDMCGTIWDLVLPWC